MTSSFGVGGRLYLAAAILSIALAATAALAYVRLGSVVATAQRTGEVRVPQLSRPARIELAITRVSLQLRHAMLARTDVERQAALQDIELKRKDIQETFAAFEAGLSTEEGRRKLEAIKPAVAAFWTLGEENLKLISAGQKDQAFAFLVDKTIPARNVVLTGLDELQRFQADTLADDIQGIRTDVQQTLAVLVGLVLTAIVGVVALAWNVTALLKRRLRVAEQAAQRVRDGELSSRAIDDRSDEFSPMLGALQEMQLALIKVVSNVRVNAEGVATASSQIAHGSQDLSSRTEQQASALQQTSATMEELGSTVRSNAENSRQADELARTASQAATAGGEVVSQVVDTMNGISDSSRRIAEIIGVVDGIAFQTNILALNAAVEAARAGDHGRGFAVVASEVRGLAQRSAEAAREIKGLITHSVEQIEHGGALVTQAGQRTRDIVAAIGRVNTVVGEISAASREQASGITQVGQAVTQMDQATQQNAAMVEQTAAAAQSMRQQAQELLGAVSSFKVVA